MRWAAWLAGLGVLLGACCFHPVCAGADCPSDAGPTHDAGSDAGPGCPAPVDLEQRVDRPADPSFVMGQAYFASASADLNGDGIRDLVVGTIRAPAFGSPGTVSVFLGQADGGLSAPVATEGADGWVVVAADLDGDGLADVLASNDGVLSVFFNRGNGVLGPATSFSFPTFETGMPGRGSLYIGVGDVNGDGRPDIVVTQYFEVYLMLNLGGGEFGPPQLLLHGPDANHAIHHGVTVGDLNGDRLADIALTSHYGFVSVLLAEPDGGFALSTEGSEFATISRGIVSVGPAGTPDLAFGSENLERGYAVAILKNDGTGHFTDGGVYPTQDEASWLLVADLNGDCIPDIVSSGVGTTQPLNGASVMYGLADGGFQAPVSLFPGASGSAAFLGPIGPPQALGLVQQEGVVSVLGNEGK
jgi:FG-GAP-like repeat